VDKLTFKEKMLIEEAAEDRKRRPDLDYQEKFVKKQLDRVIVELTGNESGVLTKLASRYDRLDKAIKVMGQKKNELNAQIKEKVEDLFAAEDVVLTRVIDTISFTMTVSKKSKVDDKTAVDYKAIAEALAALIPEELQSKVEEITKMYTTVTAQPDKSPALSVKAKVTEGLLGDLKATVVAAIKKVIKSIASWSTKFDKKLAALKKSAQV
jgi:citrate lyase gamma subunit